MNEQLHVNQEDEPTLALNRGETAISLRKAGIYVTVDDWAGMTDEWVVQKVSVLAGNNGLDANDYMMWSAELETGEGKNHEV